MGTSIYSYIETFWFMLLLIVHVGYAHWLSDSQRGRVDIASVDSTSDLLVAVETKWMKEWG